MDITKDILKFRDERNWKQYHNPKDLVISINLEASELLENFQWKSSEEALEENLENIKDEIADILIYTHLLAKDLGIDLNDVIKNKLKKNNERYPLEKAFGSRDKYTNL